MHDINLALATSGNLILSVCFMLFMATNYKMNKLQNKRIGELENKCLILASKIVDLETHDKLRTPSEYRKVSDPNVVLYNFERKD